MTFIAIIASYAILPLFLCPFLYQLVVSESKPTENTFEKIEFNGTVFVFSFVVAVSAAVILSIFAPRPRLFFVILAVLNTLAIVYSLVSFRFVLPLVGLTATNLLFHLSTTLTNALYIGSGDTLWMWASTEISLRTDELTTLAGYDLFPNYFILVKIIGDVTVLSPRVALFVTSAIMYVSCLWAITWITSELNVIPDRYTLVPAFVLSLTHQFHYIGLYSLPRSMASGVSLFLTGIVLIALANQTNFGFRYGILSVTFLVSIAFYHKIDSVLLGFVLLIVLFGDRISYGYFHNIVVNSRYHFQVIFLVAIMISLQLFLILLADIPRYVVELIEASFSYGSLLSGTTTEGGFAFSSPIGVLSTLANSSVILILFIAGFFKISEDTGHKILVLVIAGIVTAPIYFPGPLQYVFLRIGIERLAQYSLVLIVLVASIGCVELLRTHSEPLLVLLLVTAALTGTVTYSNDLYTRDNPLERTGTFSDYFTEPESDAVQFSIYHTDTVTGDRQSVSFLEYSKVVEEETGQSTRSDVTTVEETDQICTTPFLVRSGELEERGQLIVPLLEQDGESETTDWASAQAEYERYTEIERVPCITSNNRIYDSESVFINSPSSRE